jgi:protein TonB
MIALILSSITTLALFLLMNVLITNDVKPPQDDGARKLVTIHMPQREIETKYDTSKPDKPQEPEETPPDMQEPEFEQPDTDPDALNMSAPSMAPNLNVKGIGGFGSDGEYLPIVKVQPTYPRRALDRGIEGWVIVEFTVAANGSVRDPFVVDAKPKKIFDRAALKAVSKFKYKPRVIDGETVEVGGVQNKITFAVAK